MCETVIYLGPSLRESEAKTILQAKYLPPIRRGDLAGLSPSVTTVGIVDGEFFQNLAVSPKEILPMLDRGVRVFGAASMGALRAAEMHTLGMVGVGEIFRMYVDGVLDADDEVALIYEPSSYRPLSEPLVNLRRGLQMALAAGVIDAAEKDRLIELMKSTYFPDRSFRVLFHHSPAVAEYYRERPLPDVKRDDARMLLLAIKGMQPSATCEDA